MGEIAQDMVEGRSCSWCGVYFVGSHGYPVVCRNCSRSEDYDPKEDPAVATKQEL